MESELSAGGAAQRVVPQRACGCAAVLCFLAERSCKAPPFSSLAAGRRPFTKRYPHNRLALTLGNACVADR